MQVGRARPVMVNLPVNSTDRAGVTGMSYRIPPAILVEAGNRRKPSIAAAPINGPGTKSKNAQRQPPNNAATRGINPMTSTVSAKPSPSWTDSAVATKRLSPSSVTLQRSEHSYVDADEVHIRARARSDAPSQS
ncbi:hypothetical protein NKH57_27585 [Mesorhizobium sp. M1050]|uniref:hypothetical protein n=1 Tax=Mesorhizobium sp. M1050 TaxID=2957051 RepID=UPI00333CCCE4